MDEIEKLIKECRYAVAFGDDEKLRICRFATLPCVRTIEGGQCPVCIEYFGGKNAGRMENDREDGSMGSM